MDVDEEAAGGVSEGGRNERWASRCEAAGLSTGLEGVGELVGGIGASGKEGAELRGVIGTGGVKNEATWLGPLMISDRCECSMVRLLEPALLLPVVGSPKVWLPLLVEPPAPDEA